MCRMMAKVSVANTGIIEELEKCPHSLYWLSAHGRKSHDPEERGKHQDGSGLGWVEKGKIMTKKCGKDDFWNAAFHKSAAEARSTIFIAHDRDASSGLLTDERGAHPFTGMKGDTEVAFCHNGTVYSLVEEAQQLQTADSFVYMNHLLDHAHDLSGESIAASLEKFASENTFSSITGFLMTAEELFAWRIYSERDQSKIERYDKYYTLYLSLRPDHLLIASEPLDDEPNWALLPNNTFLSARPGKDGIMMEYRRINFQ